jgi:hypothetical protein
MTLGLCGRLFRYVIADGSWPLLVFSNRSMSHTSTVSGWIGGLLGGIWTWLRRMICHVARTGNVGTAAAAAREAKRKEEAARGAKRKEEAAEVTAWSPRVNKAAVVI